MRPLDTIRVVAAGREFDAFDSVELSHDMTKPSEATLTFGDDGSTEIASAILNGETWTIYVNDRPQLHGIAEMVDLAGTNDQGSRCTVVVRTRLCDADVASADPKIKTEGVSIKKFIEDLFYPLGYEPSDFIVSDEAKVRALLTGATSSSTLARKDLETIRPTQAKAQIGESIRECATRHLERHGLLMWDSPDGKLIIGRPDDAQRPSYAFRSKRLGPESNNLIGVRRVKDWTGVPAEVAIYGAAMSRGDLPPSETGDDAPVNKGQTKSFGAKVRNPQIVGSGTTPENRRMTMQATGVSNSAQATARATREMSRLSMRSNTWELLTDGWSYDPAGKRLVYGVNTVGTIDCDIMGAPSGSVLIYRVGFSWESDRGFVTSLGAVAPGIWRTEAEEVSLRDKLQRISGGSNA